VNGTIWNPSGSLPPTPPTVNWELRFRNGNTGAVLARQPITIAILKRAAPYFQSHGQASTGDSATTIMFTRIASGAIGGGLCPVIVGTMQATMLILFQPPVANTVTIQYTIDDVPVGPYVTGPSVGGAFESYPLNIDTTNAFGAGPIPDGTHALGIKLIDYVGGSSASNDLPYMWRCIQQPFIVKNSGFVSGSQTIPITDPGYGPSWRLNSSKLEFVTFPGFSSLPAHSTVVPIGSPESGFIPPVTSSSSPFFGNPTALRDQNNFFVEGIAGAVTTEYLGYPRFYVNVLGGVYGYVYNGEATQTMESAYANYISHCNFDGGRDDNQTDAFSSAIDAHDGSFWLVSEAFGRIIKLGFDGSVTTLAGATTDRTKLGFMPAAEDGAPTEADLNSVMIQVGTIGTPSFGDMRGINDLCYDPRDSTGNTIYVANPIDHVIYKITNLLAGNSTTTIIRYAGQDGGLNGGHLSPGPGLNGGFVDGPATEYVAGSTVVASFMGTINSSGVLTVNSGYTGTLSAGCPLSWSGNPNTTTGHLVTANISGSGNGSTWQTNLISPVSSIVMTASPPVALFAGPYSVQMADGTGVDPIGTMYVADYQNWAIRKISADGSTVTTLFGNQANRPGFDSSLNPSGPLGAAPAVNLASITWVSGVATVTTASAVSLFGHDIAPNWAVTLTGVTNTGAAGSAAVNGVFLVTNVTNNQNFKIAMPQVTSGDIGTIGVTGATLTPQHDDVFVPTIPSTRPLSSAYCAYPQRIVWNSSKKLIVGSTWYLSAQEIDLAAGTIKYIGTYSCTAPNSRVLGGPYNTFRMTNIISWFQIDVDAAGTCGPLDDIIMMETGGLASVFWRVSVDGSYTAAFGRQDLIHYAPLPVGSSGMGHYPWTITISRHQGRMLTSGISDAGLQQSRILNTAYDIPSDAFDNVNVDAGALDRGYAIYLQGSVQANATSQIQGIFPWGIRPGGSQLHGALGIGHLGLTSTTLGQSNGDSFDGLTQNFPTDAALAAFIQSGFGGVDPRPEITGDDLADVIYWIRRASWQGSTTMPLVQRAPFATDVTAPVISSVVVTRLTSTTVQATWNTDKPTYGFAAAGFDSAQSTSFPYHIFALETYGGTSDINLSYRTSHSVTLTGLKTGATTHVIVVSKDIAGNNAISAQQTVSGSGGLVFSPDGTISDPPSGAALVNGYGTWIWGSQIAPPGIHAATGWFWVKLNGKTVFFSGQNRIDFGGQFFADYFDGNWFCYQNNYTFSVNCSPDICAPYGPPTPIPPPIVTPPFTPSPDGTSITAPSGTVTTADGVWTWGSASGGGNYNILLNGLYINANASQMQVNSHGSLFFLRDIGGWYVWLNYAAMAATAPTSAPIPIAIDMVPSFIATMSWTAGHAGGLVTTPTVTMSDGSTFSGTWSVAPLSGQSPFLTVTGGNVVFSRDLTSSDIGGGLFSVYPSQNGVQMTSGASQFNIGITS
jgi:hypothetical protein